MEIDLELYRREIVLPEKPSVRLSAIDIAPDQPKHTFVFLHGFGGNARQWMYQLAHFSLNCRVIAVDMRGHGRADKPPAGFDMPVAIRDLEGTLQFLGVQTSFILAGHSFGGAVATEFTAAHPEQVQRLILIATAGEFHLNRLYRLGLNLPPGVLRSLTPFTRQWLSAPPDGLRPWYHNILSRWNGWSLFRNLNLPVMVVRGHRDFLFSQPMFAEVARAIPHAEEIDVGASGHMVMLERREAVNRAIERFIEDTAHRKRSWRGKEIASTSGSHSTLLKQRPWLTHYDKNVPYTIAVPDRLLHQFLHSAARRFPRQTAIFFEGQRIPYQRLAREVSRFAAGLKAMGLENGDRVMLLLPNLPQLVIGYFGTLQAGGIAVFGLPISPPEKLLHQAKKCSPKILLTSPHFAHLIPDFQKQGSLQDIILTHPGEYLPPLKRLAYYKKQAKTTSPIRYKKNIHKFSHVIYHHRPLPIDNTCSPQDGAVILFTGGTTSEAKGVLLSHRNLVANTIQTRHWIPEAREGDERFLCALPFAHSYGLTTALNVPVSIGATLILKPRFEVADILKTIKRTRPTIFMGVPQMYMAIGNYPGVRKFGIQSIQACLSGSAPLPVEVQESFEKLTRGRLVEGYGLTEASPVTHANPLNGLRKVGSIGIPLPSTQARIVSLKNSQMIEEIGQIGELAIRGPQVMRTYWQDEAASDQILTEDGWLLTGDVAIQDEDGYFRIVARKADMWYPTRPGNPAFPRDVEEVLYEIPQVREAAVVAIAGQPIAFVAAAQERPSADTILAYCQRRLPPELVPKLVIFIDALPRTFIGKVLRRELAKHYAQQSSPPT